MHDHKLVKLIGKTEFRIVYRDPGKFRSEWHPCHSQLESTSGIGCVGFAMPVLSLLIPERHGGHRCTSHQCADSYTRGSAIALRRSGRDDGKLLLVERL
jgi:hypothetical protein